MVLIFSWNSKDFLRVLYQTGPDTKHPEVQQIMIPKVKPHQST